MRSSYADWEGCECDDCGKPHKAETRIELQICRRRRRCPTAANVIRDNDLSPNLNAPSLRGSDPALTPKRAERAERAEGQGAKCAKAERDERPHEDLFRRGEDRLSPH